MKTILRKESTSTAANGESPKKLSNATKTWCVRDISFPHPDHFRFRSTSSILGPLLSKPFMKTKACAFCQDILLNIYIYIYKYKIYFQAYHKHALTLVCSLATYNTVPYLLRIPLFFSLINIQFDAPHGKKPNLAARSGLLTFSTSEL